jgi:lysophospholipase L1-like esterase
VKKAAFGLIAFVVPSVLLVFTAEFAVRWGATGGPMAALASFRPSDRDRATWLTEDPDLGYKLNPAHESVSSLGIRHRELGPKARDDWRIIVVGDSVAWDSDGFVSHIRDRLDADASRRFEVVNAAIPGYTTHQERILLERDLLPLRPDVVLLQYCMNDNHRFLHQLDEGGHWIITPEALAIPPWLPRWVAESYLVKRVHWRLLARSRAERESGDAFPWRESPEFENAWRDETWPAQERLFRAMRDATARSGSRLAIVAVPYEPQLEDQALALDAAYTLKPQQKLAEAANRLGLPFLDLHPAFLRSRDRQLFTDQIHLTDAGHRLAADEIMAFVVRENLLGPSASSGP